MPSESQPGEKGANKFASGGWASIPFEPSDAKAALAQTPQSAAVFALYGADARGEPYIGRTPNLRSRLARLLEPSEKHPRRLQLAGLVRRIEWKLTGSEFESLLAQFSLFEEFFGAKAVERMHLRPPAFIRYLGSNPYPRITVTNRPSLRESDWAYGPFPSRAAAERFSDEMLKLFLLRRCTFELAPDPSYPGCVYSEMKMCLAPCFKGCTDERYAEESSAVQRFLATRGESMLATLRAERDRASANLEFEAAAGFHAQVQNVEAVRAMAAEIVRPLSRLRAVVLQASTDPGEVAVFLYEGGRLRGPAGFSTVGMRIQNEQSGSTSLFAQPLAIEAVPEEQGAGEQGSEGAERQGLREQGSNKAVRNMLESRIEGVLGELSASAAPPSSTVRQAHLALLKRWYYRPEAKRSGEICFPDAEDHWPLKSILRSIGRVAAKSAAAHAAAFTKTPESHEPS
ncbi:MAG TPA: hypothetical protein VMT38_10570 [Terracidiphilus sp.]|nr:hypothetical protein [Terracidiphilus sp.]